MNSGDVIICYLELRKTRSIFPIPLEFEISKLTCITQIRDEYGDGTSVSSLLESPEKPYMHLHCFWYKFLFGFLCVHFQLPNDDIEKNYKSLMKEHMALQKSMMKLQGMLGCRTDPQRYTKVIGGVTNQVRRKQVF